MNFASIVLEGYFSSQFLPGLGFSEHKLFDSQTKSWGYPPRGVWPGRNIEFFGNFNFENFQKNIFSKNDIFKNRNFENENV